MSPPSTEVNTSRSRVAGPAGATEPAHGPSAEPARWVHTMANGFARVVSLEVMPFRRTARERVGEGFRRPDASLRAPTVAQEVGEAAPPGSLTAVGLRSDLILSTAWPPAGQRS